MVAIVSILSFGLALAYADEFRMPFNPDNLVRHWVDVVFVPTENGGVDVTVSQNSLFHYDTIIEMPDYFYDQTYNNQGGISISDAIQIKQTYENIVSPIIEQEPKKSKLTPEIQALLDEKVAEREAVVEKALTCILGIEGSSIFTEYRERLVLEKMVYFKSLPLMAQERQIVLWTEECRTWNESYISKSPEYRDKYIAERDNPPYSKVLDETDSPFTDPLTEKDFAQEIEDAERFMCSQEGKQRGLCIKEFEGINRGGYTGGAECQVRPAEPGAEIITMCPLFDYNTHISSAISAEENYTVIEKLVCEKYMNQYQALIDRIKSGDETAKLPNWLAHCEVEIDENE